MTLIALPTPTEWDIAHLQKCHSDVRVRRLIELAIVRKLVQALIPIGYAISVDDGGEDYAVKRSTDEADIMEAAFAVDECELIIHTATGKHGWIALVYGNDGWDVISDHSTNLESALASVSEYAEQLAEWC